MPMDGRQVAWKVSGGIQESRRPNAPFGLRGAYTQGNQKLALAYVTGQRTEPNVQFFDVAISAWSEAVDLTRLNPNAAPQLAPSVSLAIIDELLQRDRKRKRSHLRRRVRSTAWRVFAAEGSPRAERGRGTTPLVASPPDLQEIGGGKTAIVFSQGYGPQLVYATYDTAAKAWSNITEIPGSRVNVGSQPGLCFVANRLHCIYPAEGSKNYVIWT